jgi:hypothetical protein
MYIPEWLLIVVLLPLIVAGMSQNIAAAERERAQYPLTGGRPLLDGAFSGTFCRDIRSALVDAATGLRCSWQRNGPEIIISAIGFPMLIGALLLLWTLR